MVRILWVDDEIELLKPHVLFLEKRGYAIFTCNNGYDAIDMFKQEHFDLVILDEMMPGMTGLDMLPLIKDISPDVPIIMVTKSEEDDIMDKAIGSKIADYIIKPVNPRQVLSSIKKFIHSEALVTEKTTADYRSEFGRLSQSMQSADSFADWCNLYRKLTNWDIEIAQTSDQSIREVLNYQQVEARQLFSRFVCRNYVEWINRRGEDTPVMSHTLMRDRVLPVLEQEMDRGGKTTLLLIDNFRYDQWREISSQLRSLFEVETDGLYCSILPTATQYARNAMFAGMMPLEIAKKMPEKWVHDHEGEAKNQYEEEFLSALLRRNGLEECRVSYDKLVRPEQGRKLLANMQHIHEADLSVIVYNFLDVLSHARTETNVVRELTEDDASYRSLTRSWFDHSELYSILRQLSQKGHTVIITSDHGTVRVDKAIKVTGDKQTSANLRYKTGRNLAYNHREVFEVTRPENIQLPSSNITSSYIFAYDSDFFVYNNDANRHIRYYKSTFQHGGISMEEMLVPYVVLKPKRVE
ncbi:MAG: PglZ domain-containing protein [Rikenellaceae bacterium]